MILLVIGGFNVFTSVLLMTGNDPLQQKQVPLTYMYDQAFAFLDFGYGSAISFLLTIVVLALAGLQYVVTQRRVRGDVHVIVGDRRQRIAGDGRPLRDARSSPRWCSCCRSCTWCRPRSSRGRWCSSSRRS